MGIHPIKIANGFDEACKIAIDHLDQISESLFDINDKENPYQYVIKLPRLLGSKIVSKEHNQFAQMAVDAITQVVNWERKDVDFDLIKLEGKLVVL